MPLRSSKEGGTCRRSNAFWISVFLILLAEVQCFSTTSKPTLSVPSPIQEKTVGELWYLLENSDHYKRGLKSQLKRKQDIVEYIEENFQIVTDDDESQEGHQAPNDNDDDIQSASALKEKEDPTQEHDDDDDDEIQEDQQAPNDDDDIQSAYEEAPLEEKDDSKEELDVPEGVSSHIDSEIQDQIPPFLAKKMDQRKITSLLPIQAKSFQRIYSGEDVVLQAPTGSGKTLAFVFPLLAKKGEERRTEKGKGRRMKFAGPLTLVLAPSRELAQQVGREFDKFSQGTAATTVFGGVPIERHVALLRKIKPQVLISTPGRLRELFRSGHLDYSQISTVVLDEADTMLDKADSPDVRAILKDLEQAVMERGDDAEYQLVLVSATMNQNVLQFARDLEIPGKALIRVRGDESKVPSTTTSPQISTSGAPQVQSVQHWHMSCKATVRPSIAMDLISILEPLLTIVFVASKAEAESVASIFSSKLGGSVRVLHGDMVQSARSRSLALIREAAKKGDAQVLVATDVASRGIDLAVDLVIQFGVPRISGKEGTFSTELYTHRTGRTGRVRSDDGVMRKANAIMLYDPAVGEGKLVPHLADAVEKELGIQILQKQLPSAAEVVSAAYERTKGFVSLGEREPDENDLTIYFRQVLETDKGVDTSSPEQLLEYLARAMTLLSNVDPSISPFRQHSSLLSGSSSDRTLRLIGKDKEGLAPPIVTTTCKELGSGKLGRVLICQDGSAVFDLPEKRAVKLLAAFEANNQDFQLELPLTLPDL